ncbi:hypothetical protein, partial [Klebsiella pneumoniae]|uniref:hypothetical protein n=1 Tax=Klebsiella pneumoniae TaxID=573 RepID=UPI003CFD42D1
IGRDLPGTGGLVNCDAYPPRAWTGPPLPLAAAAEVERARAQAEFDAEQTYGAPAEDDDPG